MADNRNKNQNLDKNKTGQQQGKPQRPVESEGNRQQSGNRPGVGGGMNKDLDKDVGNENREVQKDLDTDETDEGELDEQAEITQRNPRMGEDQSKR